MGLKLSVHALAPTLADIGQDHIVNLHFVCALHHFAANFHLLAHFALGHLGIRDLCGFALIVHKQRHPTFFRAGSVACRLASILLHAFLVTNTPVISVPLLLSWADTNMLLPRASINNAAIR